MRISQASWGSSKNIIHQTWRQLLVTPCTLERKVIASQVIGSPFSSIFFVLNCNSSTLLLHSCFSVNLKCIRPFPAVVNFVCGCVGVRCVKSSRYCWSVQNVRLGVTFLEEVQFCVKSALCNCNLISVKGALIRTGSNLRELWNFALLHATLCQYF